MKIIKWVVKKMEIVRENKKIKKLPLAAKMLILSNRPVSIQKVSILACKDFTKTGKHGDGTENKK